MATKKRLSRPPSSLIEEVDSEQSGSPGVPNVLGRDVVIDNQSDEVHTEAMSTIVDIIYGESYRNFEIALFQIGMDMSCLETFQAFVYTKLMNGDFFNIPGAKSNKGLAMIIAQAAEYFYKETDAFGDFVLSLDKWYQGLLSEQELASYKPIKNGEQLPSLIDRILTRLHP